jgi:hypothetical protein
VGLELKGKKDKRVGEIIKKTGIRFSDEKGWKYTTDTKGKILHFVFDSQLCVYSKAETLKGTASPLYEKNILL